MPVWQSASVDPFIGGKKAGAHGSKDKTIVMGAAERDGRIRLKVVPNRGRKEARDFFDEYIGEADAVYTDKLQSYKGAAKTRKLTHGTVDHSRKEWINGKIHTNTIEGVWSLLDRSIIGAYHKVSTKHLPAYLHEVEWRYNNRDNPYLFRDTILELIDCKPMEYAKLTA